MENFQSHSREIERLTEIHIEIAGPGPGHKHDVEVLHKSAIDPNGLYVDVVEQIEPHADFWPQHDVRG
jgi:hypothetical protein